jgi:iron complex transport system permease protein
LLICLAASLCLGQLNLSPAELVRAMASRQTDPQTLMLIELRAHRVLLAGLAGAALAIAGVLVQGVVRNPLAAPETLGVTGGASLAALAALLLVPELPVVLVPFAAFLGGGAALPLTLWIAGPRASGHRIALAGIALAAAFGAGTSLLIVQADVRVAQALVWLAGSVYGRDWSTLLALGGWLAVLMPLIVLSVRPLDVLAVGRSAARSLGVAWPRTPRAILLLSAALAAAAVAAVGAVAFLGLVAPHLARLFTGPRHRRLVPLAALVGALLLMTADLLGRTLLAPRQIPAGIVTAIIGAPYFVYLLARSRRGQ